MKKTNSKEVMKAIENKIIESYEAAEEYFHMTGKRQKPNITKFAKTF